MGSRTCILASNCCLLSCDRLLLILWVLCRTSLQMGRPKDIKKAVDINFATPSIFINAWSYNWWLEFICADLEGTGNFWVPKTLLCWRFFPTALMNCQKTNSFHGLIPDQNGQSVYPLSDQNGAKILPDGAAHTYIAYIRGSTGGGGGDSSFSLLFHLNSYRAFFCLKVKCFLPCKMHHCSL